jgi:hypothetical protein
MIDVSTIIHDPDFEQPFQLVRVTGAFHDGDWTPAEAAPIDVKGIVLPAKLDELVLLPEGERLGASVAIYAELELSNGNQKDKQPDLVLYSGSWYRVAYTRYYAQCNLWYALAVRFQRD